MGPRRNYREIRQRGFGTAVVLVLFLLGAVVPQALHAGLNEHVSILYFFSPSDKLCLEAKPSVIALSRAYNVEGRNVGTIAAAGYPFPVKSEDKNRSTSDYGVKGVPELVVFIDAIRRLNIAGAQDIADASVIIKALANGAMIATEVMESKPEGDIAITGWIGARGEYFKQGQFFITDRSTELPVRAWLPLETMRRMGGNGNRSRPRLMSDVVGKPVVLRGSVNRNTSGAFFLVKEEIPVE